MSKSVGVKDLVRVETEMTRRQIEKFFSETPNDKIYTRPAKGGGVWKYVKGSYVVTVLNSLFGYNWDFETKTGLAEAMNVAEMTGVVTVLGRLTCRVGDQPVVKEQWGRAEVKYKKGTKDFLDFGNDLKAATTDALKKCASEWGLFADVYSPDDFLNVRVVDETPEKLENNSDKLDEAFSSRRGKK